RDTLPLGVAFYGEYRQAAGAGLCRRLRFGVSRAHEGAKASRKRTKKRVLGKVAPADQQLLLPITTRSAASASRDRLASISSARCSSSYAPKFFAFIAFDNMTKAI